MLPEFILIIVLSDGDERTRSAEAHATGVRLREEGAAQSLRGHVAR